jgi:hypothetical protein
MSTSPVESVTNTENYWTRKLLDRHRSNQNRVKITKITGHTKLLDRHRSNQNENRKSPKLLDRHRSNQNENYWTGTAQIKIEHKITGQAPLKSK